MPENKGGAMISPCSHFDSQVAGRSLGFVFYVDIANGTMLIPYSALKKIPAQVMSSRALAAIYIYQGLSWAADVGDPALSGIERGRWCSLPLLRANTAKA